jgi:uncharacterized repeat protein (TIGR02543 family)
MVSESGENRTIYIYVDDEYMNESDTDYYPTRTSISASDLNVTGLTYDGVSYSSSNNTVVASGTTYNVYLYGNYKVKFDANGGTVSSSSTTYTKKDKITLPTPTRTGYTFGGWKVKSLDTTRNNWTTGTTYTASSISAGKYGSVTLEAQWTPINYTITYDANGGTSVSSQSYTIEDSISLPQLTREGFSFKGWKATSVAGNWTAGTTYTDASITAGQYGNVTLQAQWGAATYSVVFNGNGATHANSTKGGTMSDQSFTYGTAQNLTANAYERKYTVTYDTQGGDEIEPTVVAAEFLGWSTTEAGSKVYEDKQSVQNLTSTDGAIINLYALWSDVRSVELPTLTRENTEDASYTFLGWYTEPEGKGDEITTGAYTPTDDITLYAYWDVRTTLTIQKEFKNGCEEANKDQVFLFAITSPENENFRMTVTVQGDEPVVIHDVPIGTYIVQENTDWSWLYPGDEQSQKQEVSETEHDVVTFTETEWNAYYWLTGFANTVKSIAGIVGGDQSDANE